MPNSSSCDGHSHPPSHNNRALKRPSGLEAPTGEQQYRFTCRLEGIKGISLQKAYRTGTVFAARPENLKSESVQVMLVKMGELV